MLANIIIMNPDLISLFDYLCSIGKPVKTDSVTFLITVNDSWKYDPPISNDTCMTTVKTFAMAPDTPKNKSKNIEVGDCDNGPLIYHVNEEEDTKSSIFSLFIPLSLRMLHHPLALLTGTTSTRPLHTLLEWSLT